MFQTEVFKKTIKLRWWRKMKIKLDVLVEKIKTKLNVLVENMKIKLIVLGIIIVVFSIYYNLPREYLDQNLSAGDQMSRFLLNNNRIEEMAMWGDEECI